VVYGYGFAHGGAEPSIFSAPLSLMTCVSGVLAAAAAQEQA